MASFHNEDLYKTEVVFIQSATSIRASLPSSSSSYQLNSGLLPSLGISTCSAPSSSCHKCKYDVFLSFRGKDTRLSFVDHLSHALDQKKIVTFRDDKDLEKGNTIAPELLKAIEESRISLVILSPNYASSTWCLDELLKILQCRQDKGQMLLPIFYQVKPSDVRNKNGRFLKAVKEHGRVHPNRVDRWKAALIEVSSIAGWVTRDKHEACLVNDIVEFVLKCQKVMCAYEHGKAVEDSLVMKELKDIADDVENVLDVLEDEIGGELEEIANDAENVLDEFKDKVEDIADDVLGEFRAELNVKAHDVVKELNECEEVVQIKAWMSSIKKWLEDD